MWERQSESVCKDEREGREEREREREQKVGVPFRCQVFGVPTEFNLWLQQPHGLF